MQIGEVGSMDPSLPTWTNTTVTGYEACKKDGESDRLKLLY